MEVGQIEVTGVPLAALVRAAYRPSRPQGLGFIHYQDGDLTDAEVAEIIERDKESPHIAVSMDYVKGRSCKFHVRRDGKRLFIGNSWYDHSTEQLKSLLSVVGLKPELVDQAKDEERRHHDACVEKALSYLNKNGGSVRLTLDGATDEEIQLGLYVVNDRGIVDAGWDDHRRVWSLKKAA